MLRFLAGVGSALLFVMAGFFIWKGVAQDEEVPLPPAPPPQAEASSAAGPPPMPPASDERTREQTGG